MTYATCYIVRFEGTLTQGPNAGKSFTFGTSWAGVMFDTIEKARELVAKYQALEPGLSFRILSRQYQDKPKGFAETVVE